VKIFWMTVRAFAADVMFSRTEPKCSACAFVAVLRAFAATGRLFQPGQGDYGA
jgi:hypothetical protein